MDKLLLLEDDVALIDGLTYSLRKQGYEIDIVRTVSEALALLPGLSQYALLLLDITLPDGTGFEFCERIRTQNQQIPIIFLTASDEEVSVIRGLDSGGDDYITKPFKLGELCSRIRALLRRSGMTRPDQSESIKCGNIQIDLLGSRVSLSERNTACSACW